MKFGFKEWMVMVILALIWGTSFILMKRGLEVYSPYQVASLRIFISFIIFIPFFIKHFKSIRARDWKFIACVGIFGSGIPPYLFTTAQVHIPSSIAGILNSLSPLFTFVLGLVFFGSKFSIIRFIGVLLGFIGALSLIVLRFDTSVGISSTYYYGILIMIATFMYAISVNVLKNFLQEAQPTAIAAAAFMVIGPPATIYLFTTDFIQLTASHEGMKAFIYMFILASLGTVLALIMFNKLIQQTNALFASTVTYLMPGVAVLWGLMDGEPVQLLTIIGMSLILVGVYLAGKE